MEHWSRDAQLLLVASHKYSYVTVRRECSTPLRGCDEREEPKAWL